MREIAAGVALMLATAAAYTLGGWSWLLVPVCVVVLHRNIGR